MRRSFHDRLAVVHADVDDLANVVVRAIPNITAALLAGEAEAAAAVAATDGVIDARVPAIEQDIFDLVATQAPVARDLRFLISSLRILYEVDLSGNLIVSISQRVGRI